VTKIFIHILAPDNLLAHSIILRSSQRPSRIHFLVYEMEKNLLVTAKVSSEKWNLHNLSWDSITKAGRVFAHDIGDDVGSLWPTPLALRKALRE
jgi:hypothetical protein